MPAVLALAALLAAAPAPASRPPGGPAVAASLGAGGELQSGSGDGVSELELAGGWDAGAFRPELALVLGFAPGTYAAVRPGGRYELPELPVHVRAAFDWSHVGGDWRFRWLLVGAAVELRATSVLGFFAEADAGIPFTSDFGLGLLARAGFAFRL